MYSTATKRVEKRLRNFLALSLALMGAVCVPLRAQMNAQKDASSGLVVDSFLQQAELTASDGALRDYFGRSVALSSDGNTALVGANNKTVVYGGQGAVYVFTYSGGSWSQKQELTASDGAADNYFGVSVALSSDGNTALVGASFKTVGSNSYQGAAYVFTNSGGSWSQQQELTASNGAASDYFGNSVALSSDGTTALVGANNKTVGSNASQGAAYVFTNSGGSWSQKTELTASNGAASDYFGYPVALSSDGNTALVAAPQKTVGSNNIQGAAYAFTNSGGSWNQQHELTASDGAAVDYFGNSVALSSDGNTALVGATGKTIVHNSQGAAYVFTNSGGSWSQQAELTASDAALGDDFGSGAALSSDGTTALVGAFGKKVGSNSQQGAAYVFTNSGGSWSQQQELTASNGAAGDYFGYPVAQSGNGNTALVGAGYKTLGSNSDQGAAYVFASSSSTTVTLSPTALNFGNQAVNTTSAAKTVTLTNTGTDTVNISSVAITAGNSYFAVSSNTCGATLNAGKNCKVKITFTPTQLAAETGTLTFTDNASGNPQTVSLSGTGVAQATLTPSSYTFPKTKVGSTSTAKTFTLKNNLPTTLTGISYSTKAPFTVSTSTCTTTLNSKKSCTISVTFSPTVTGTKTGTLTVNDSANNSPQTSSLTGTGD